MFFYFTETKICSLVALLQQLQLSIETFPRVLCYSLNAYVISAFEYTKCLTLRH